MAVCYSLSDHTSRLSGKTFTYCSPGLGPANISVHLRTFQYKLIFTKRLPSYNQLKNLSCHLPSSHTFGTNNPPLFLYRSTASLEEPRYVYKWPHDEYGRCQEDQTSGRKGGHVMGREKG